MKCFQMSVSVEKIEQLYKNYQIIIKQLKLNY